MKSRGFLTPALRLVIMIMACFFLFGGNASAQSTCELHCENPRLIDRYVQSAGCGGCQFFQVYFHYTEVFRYSCSNGGTCTVTERFEEPCGVCPY